MFRKVLPIVALATLTNAAGAADLLVKRPPVADPVVSWNGFHIGVNGGYTETLGTTVSGQALFGSPVLVAGAAANGSAASAVNATIGRRGGGLVGGQIGYDWQFERFVIGAEADFDASFVRQTANVNSVVPLAGFPANPVNGMVSVTQRLDNFGTVRGRFGVLATPTLLIYATAGLAYGKIAANVSIREAVVNAAALPNGFGTMLDASMMRYGATVGGGAEWKFAPNWSLKAEGLYYDIGRATSNGRFSSFNNQGTLFTTTGAGSLTTSRGFVVRGGLNYSFDTGKLFSGLF